MMKPNAYGKRSLLASLAAAGALSGLLAVNLPAHAEGRDGPPPRHQGPCNHGPKDMGKRMEMKVDRLFSRVGASEDQKARARDIVRAANEEMARLRDSDGKPGERHERMLQLLTADTLDRDAIEQQRTMRQSHMDQASRLMTRTVTDLAEVLTPAQRKEAAKELSMLGAGGPAGARGPHGRPPRHGDGPPDAPRG